jgi:hypothetical protein
LSNLLNCLNNKLPWMMPSYLFEECWRVKEHNTVFWVFWPLMNGSLNWTNIFEKTWNFKNSRVRS